MYYNVIKHFGHLGTLEKCRKHSPAARVFYISLVFSNARRVLSQCNTRLRLLYLLNIEVPTTALPIKEARLTGSPLLYSTSLSMAFSTALDNALVSMLPQELKLKNMLILYNKFLKYFISLMMRRNNKLQKSSL